MLKTIVHKRVQRVYDANGLVVLAGEDSIRINVGDGPNHYIVFTKNNRSSLFTALGSRFYWAVQYAMQNSANGEEVFRACTSKKDGTHHSIHVAVFATSLDDGSGLIHLDFQFTLAGYGEPDNVRTKETISLTFPQLVDLYDILKKLKDNLL